MDGKERKGKARQEPLKVVTVVKGKGGDGDD